jgi:hypothetical protein
MVRYKINSGVEKIKSKYRKYIAASATGLLIAGAAAVPAFAASNDYCGSSANGCEAAQVQAQEHLAHSVRITTGRVVQMVPTQDLLTALFAAIAKAIFK